MKRAILALLVLTACEEPPKGPPANPQVAFEVSPLFTTVEGCKVYRFRDAGHYRYFTTCPGGTNSDFQSGKTRFPENVPTAVEAPSPPQHRAVVKVDQGVEWMKMDCTRYASGAITCMASPKDTP